MSYIPVNIPNVTPEDIASVNKALGDGWISSEGPIVEQFERDFSSRFDRLHGAAVSNGTAALDLCIAALDLEPGDEVVLPSFTIVSCVSEILRSGAKPIFVDIDPVTWSVDPAHVLSAINARTRAVIVVHIYGLPVDIDPILDECSCRGIFVIEDAAEAHGLLYKGRKCGSLGDASIFSFYANKNVTTGEGGIVVTDNEDFIANVKYLRNLAFEPEKRFFHQRLGWNYRMGSLQAALGISQLRRLDDTIRRRREIAAAYIDRLGNNKSLTFAPSSVSYAQNDFWVVGFLLTRAGESIRDSVMDELHARGVGTRPFFSPLHMQPIVTERFPVQPNLPITESVGQSGLYVPNFLTITEQQIDQVCDAVEEVVERIVM